MIQARVISSPVYKACSIHAPSLSLVHYTRVHPTMPVTTRMSFHAAAAPSQEVRDKCVINSATPDFALLVYESSNPRPWDFDTAPLPFSGDNAILSSIDMFDTAKYPDISNSILTSIFTASGRTYLTAIHRVELQVLHSFLLKKGIRPPSGNPAELYAAAFTPIEAKLAELKVRDFLLEDISMDGTFTPAVRKDLSWIVQSTALSYSDCKGREFNIYNTDPHLFNDLIRVMAYLAYRGLLTTPGNKAKDAGINTIIGQAAKLRANNPVPPQVGNATPPAAPPIPPNVRNAKGYYTPPGSPRTVPPGNTPAGHANTSRLPAVQRFIPQIGIYANGEHCRNWQKMLARIREKPALPANASAQDAVNALHDTLIHMSSSHLERESIAQAETVERVHLQLLQLAISQEDAVKPQTPFRAGDPLTVGQAANSSACDTFLSWVTSELEPGLSDKTPGFQAPPTVETSYAQRAAGGRQGDQPLTAVDGRVIPPVAGSAHSAHSAHSAQSPPTLSFGAHDTSPNPPSQDPTVRTAAQLLQAQRAPTQSATNPDGRLPTTATCCDALGGTHVDKRAKPNHTVDLTAAPSSVYEALTRHLDNVESAQLINIARSLMARTLDLTPGEEHEIVQLKLDAFLERRSSIEACARVISLSDAKRFLATLSITDHGASPGHQAQPVQGQWPFANAPPQQQLTLNINQDESGVSSNELSQIHWEALNARSEALNLQALASTDMSKPEEAIERFASVQNATLTRVFMSTPNATQRATPAFPSVHQCQKIMLKLLQKSLSRENLGHIPDKTLKHMAMGLFRHVGLQAFVARSFSRKELKYNEAVEIIKKQSSELIAAVRRIRVLYRIVWNIKSHSNDADRAFERIQQYLAFGAHKRGHNIEAQISLIGAFLSTLESHTLDFVSGITNNTPDILTITAPFITGDGYGDRSTKATAERLDRAAAACKAQRAAGEGARDRNTTQDSKRPRLQPSHGRSQSSEIRGPAAYFRSNDQSHRSSQGRDQPRTPQGYSSYTPRQQAPTQFSPQHGGQQRNQSPNQYHGHHGASAFSDVPAEKRLSSQDLYATGPNNCNLHQAFIREYGRNMCAHWAIHPKGCGSGSCNLPHQWAQGVSHRSLAANGFIRK